MALDLLHERTSWDALPATCLPPGRRPGLPQRTDQEGPPTPEHRLHRYRSARAMFGFSASRAGQGPGRRLVPFANDSSVSGDLSGGAGAIYRLGVDSLEPGNGSADVQEPQLRSGCGNDFCLRSRGIRNNRFDSTVRAGVHGVQRGAGRFDTGARIRADNPFYANSRKARPTDRSALADRAGLSAERLCAVSYQLEP